MTQSEREWLIEQMASQRKRPVNPARSGDAGQSRPPDAVAPVSAPRSPSTGEPSDMADRERTTVRRPSPSATDSFWSFG